MTEVGVVHLVRQKNGLAPFERFLASYRKYPAGMQHALILIFKGFPFRRGTRAHDRLLAEVPHRRLYVADYGFDVRPYLKAVEGFDYPYFCFLNSFSRILDGDWLAKLHRSIAAPGVGLVGATGSYESFSSNYLERAKMLAPLRPLARLRWRFTHLLGNPSPAVVAQRAGAWMAESLGIQDPRHSFPSFPNFHLRTNAFMAARPTLLQIRSGLMLFKHAAYAFESGRDSITNQTIHLGLKPLVVARSGEAFEKERWHLSNTFRQLLQENLLIADNQTDAYAVADATGRAMFSRQAWREFAKPA
jgi:hypothetical protein